MSTTVLAKRKNDNLGSNGWDRNSRVGGFSDCWRGSDTFSGKGSARRRIKKRGPRGRTTEMKPGLETALRNLLQRYGSTGYPLLTNAEMAPFILRALSEFNIETGNSETVDIPVTDAAKPTVPEGCCELCGQPMPEGEEMFKYHGYSGPCPVRDGEK
jgi:hypothetical protein